MSDTKVRILVIEDDPSIQLGLRMSLEREGYEVQLAEDGELGLEAARERSCDLIILDIMLPKLNGYEFMGALSAEQIDTPVLILSARGEEADMVMGLDLGAQDYMTKPFSVPELQARVRAALRRREGNIVLWKFGDVTIDPAQRKVNKNDNDVELTHTEFNILSTLVQARGRVVSRKTIFEAVWGTGHHGTHRTIDNFVAQLRSKLEDDPTAPRHLVTVRGLGYRLAID